MDNSYTQTFAKKNNIIGISGIIGVGKSTLGNNLSEKLQYNYLKEPVETNEYLESFYKDMSKYSFPMQVYLLNHRFKQHQQMVWSDNSTIQDRTIYEDVIFAKMLRESGNMEELDFKTYVDLFSNMSNFLHRPDLIIYLDVEPEVALERVKKRSRDCETDLTLEYLSKLKQGYEEWINDIKDRIPILYLDWNTFQDTEKVIVLINHMLQKKKGLIV
jgi:deoxyadenosine kinase|tara:strand:- start:1984 stop:2631 length:648 start_codon:yes stop_codon:yes gene_type:complete